MPLKVKIQLISWAEGSENKKTVQDIKEQDIFFADIPVMAAYLMLIGLLFVLINLVVDLLYFVVDPRLRGPGAARAGH